MKYVVIFFGLVCSLFLDTLSQLLDVAKNKLIGFCKLYFHFNITKHDEH
jgi:hypothetical protein